MGFFDKRPGGRPVADSCENQLYIPSFLRQPVAEERDLGLAGVLVERDLEAAVMETQPVAAQKPIVPLPEKHAEIIGRYIEHLDGDISRLTQEITTRQQQLAEAQLTKRGYEANFEEGLKVIRLARTLGKFKDVY